MGEATGSAVLGGVFAFVALASVVLGAFNLVLDEYAKGAIRAAIEQGARAGASWGGTPLQCEATANKALGSLLRGPFGDQVHIVCLVGPGDVSARAYGRLPSLLPVVPSLQVEMTAIANAGAGAN
ncbi:MAG TPA: hypothetical protein VFN61_07920 [Acidimicrobiales bacterium]|nr:hypothetical protein [Acidimicrobiales bacterium]